MPSISMSSSSSRRSSAPQVKAPCAPPPCSARLMTCLRQSAVQPPSTESVVPVIWSAAGEQRKATQPPICSTVANCCEGWRCEQHLADHRLAVHVVLLHRVGDLRLDQRGQHVAGADGVAGDRLLGGLERDHLGEADDAVLGRDVGRLEGRGGQAVRRGDVDDPAPALRAHQRQRRGGGVEGRGEVDRDDLVPLLGREVGDRRDVLDAGVVDQDVDAADRLGGAWRPAPGSRRRRPCRPGRRSARTPCSSAIRSASAWSSGRSVKELSTTSAPSRASSSATPRPIPEFDPVTTAHFPASDMHVSPSCKRGATIAFAAARSQGRRRRGGRAKKDALTRRASSR